MWDRGTDDRIRWHLLGGATLRLGREASSVRPLSSEPPANAPLRRLPEPRQRRQAGRGVSRTEAPRGGLEPFLDTWCLVAGESWQEALEEAVHQSGCCAVFLGPVSKGGAWRAQETQ